MPQLHQAEAQKLDKLVFPDQQAAAPARRLQAAEQQEPAVAAFRSARERAGLRRAGGPLSRLCSMTAKDVLKLAKEKGAKIIDLRFIDLPGLWQHFSIPVSELNEDIFRTGSASTAPRSAASRPTARGSHGDAYECPEATKQFDPPIRDVLR